VSRKSIGHGFFRRITLHVLDLLVEVGSVAKQEMPEFVSRREVLVA
jgi:hypothetical protein